MTPSRSSDGGCGDNLDRRRFLQMTGSAAIAWHAAQPFSTIAGPFEPKDTADHFVPANKKLREDWVKSLFAKGEPEWFSGENLKMIGMPVGGIGAGQLYLTGDGSLTHWDIFNGRLDKGRDGTHYQVMPEPVSSLKQGFAVSVRTGDKTVAKILNREGFPEVRFRGEYPIGTVQYPDKALPVTITLEAFSPFIPLNAADSALPATLLQFTIKNTSQATAEVQLAGWLENGVCCHSGELFDGVRQNRVVNDKNLTMILGTARAVTTATRTNPRPAIVVANFDQPDYGNWKVEGTAFGPGPVPGAFKGQQPVSGFQGKSLVNSFFEGDKTTGKLTSPKFIIQRNFINLLVGGGNSSTKTCVNLVVNGKVFRTATGRNREQLTWQSWSVKEISGQEVHLEIIDRATGPWGHINADFIEQSDIPRRGTEGPLDKQHDFGSMGLALLDKGESVSAMVTMPEGGVLDWLKRAGELSFVSEVEKNFSQTLCGVLGKRLTLTPGEQTRISFAVTWHFPNFGDHGNYYTIRFKDALEVARYLATNLERLAGQTRLWRDTWYDSSLPTWLLDRLFAPVSILASSTCQWWANGRFWAWEGVRCCAGTCAHVWNYEHAMARLFPELERSVREMQDFGTGFVEDTGAVKFRGESNTIWAGDSQGGTVLKAWREHQMSANPDFLKRNWPRIRKVVEFLLKEDGNNDGLIEGSQHNTYDINFQGANTMVGSLYLGALRAAEEMAREVGDYDFASRCRQVFEAGSRNSVEKLFNGEYFIQTVDLTKFPKHQYADGCLSDHLFGQGWAHQVGLGYLYPKEKVQSALKAIWTYNWAPDIAPQNAAHPPQRWFAKPGEAGLFTCTWPKSKHLGPDSVLYRDEIWTGIEYQVAGHMVWEGMLTEALAICRGIHERYQPGRQNPWNEVECGDHYARAMASYGVYLGLCGYEYNGPKGFLGFAPRLSTGKFSGAFTTAEGWGSYKQTNDPQNFQAQVALHYGKLKLRSFSLNVGSGVKSEDVQVTVGETELSSTVKFDGPQVNIKLEKDVILDAGKVLVIKIKRA